jgi:cation diffusion facilitator CzcD-associated flavoprotein CzcO
MESEEPAEPQESGVPDRIDVDVLVVGAGIIGIYQLYRAREAGFSVACIEAGDGAGGTWYWNRYPGARFDSESYTYGYLFSRELFMEWEWQEHFSGQPEVERYLNHVLDRFDLRRHMRFGKRVVSAIWEESTGTWAVRTSDGTGIRTRILISATGVLSVPYYPDVPGRERFRGEAYHTGLWPDAPIDFTGKRVAVIGTGSSGVQVVPEVADEVASLIVYQRTANWCTPLNNRPITAEEQELLRADFEQLCEKLSTSPSGLIHDRYMRGTFEDSPEERRAFYERLWNTPGFAKFSSNYFDMKTDPAANAEWCKFIAEKIRGIVDDPAIADKLIPKDHRYADKRPPFVTGYFEAFNNPKVELVELSETPILGVTETGIETTEGHREFDIIVWATGFDFATGALTRMGIRGRNGLALVDHWKDGPRTFLGVQSAGFPNLFYPGGPHGAAANNPRYGGDQVDFIMDELQRMRDLGCYVVEIDAAAEEEWTDMVNTLAETPVAHGDISYFFGANIPGKPRSYLINAGGRPKLFEVIANTKKDGFKVVAFSRSPAYVERSA